MNVRKTHRRWQPLTVLVVVFALLTAYLIVTYVFLPLLWLEHEKPGHQAFESLPKVTHNAEGIPGDPLNVGLIGSREQLIPTTLESSIKIAGSVLFHRPDLDAPVSNLFVFDRKQDLAFEKEVGSSASRRHHVRWWQSNELDEEGRPSWVGSATYDIRAGLSHLTKQITHHIDPDVDAQRNQLIEDLSEAGQLQRQFQVLGVGPTQNGRNAGGDRYYTDGMLSVGVLIGSQTTIE